MGLSKKSFTNRDMLRRIVQLALCLPILIISPLAVTAGFLPFIPSFWSQLFQGEILDVLEMLALAVGAYGILALPFAIFLPATRIQARKWLRNLLVGCLAGGSATAILLFSSAIYHREGYLDILRILWFLGGPVIVAAWCIFRIFQKPNAAQGSAALSFHPEGKPRSG